MIELFALGGLVLAGLLIFGVLALVLGLIKLVLFAVLLPIRLFFKLLFLPIRLLLGLLLLPLAAVGLVVGFVAVVLAGVFAIVVPLLPFFLLGLVIWAIAKSGHKSVRTAS